MTRPVPAAVLHQAGQPLRLAEITLPAPGPGQVRVRMAAVGVCHSDKSLASGMLRHAVPAVLGHEGAGRVAAVGDGVTDLAPGDPVVLNWSPACRDCWWCHHGEPWLCAHAAEPGQRPYARLADGSEVYPGLGVGGFGAETIVAASACVPVPADLPLVEAALLGCAVLTGVGAVRNAARVQPGDSVVVIGLGGVGLAAVQGARLAGAAQILAVDPAPGKAELALRLGATEVLPGGAGLAKQVRERTGGRGADHAIECVGRPETIRAAWSSTRRGGQAVIVGVGGRTDEVTFHALEIHHFARKLTASVYGDTDPVRDIPRLIEDYRAGRLDLASLVTEQVPLAQVNEAMDRLGTGARSVVVFPE